MILELLPFMLLLSLQDNLKYMYSLVTIDFYIYLEII